MSRVDVLVLGPVAVRVDGRPVSPSAKNVRALLGLLAVAGGRGVSDSGLAEGLWGDPANDVGLRVLVHRTRGWLREAAGDAVALRRTSSGYVLAVESGTCDVEVFRETVAGAFEHHGAERAVVLESALALWRGRPLDDVRVPAVETTHRPALEQARIAVVADCAEAWLAAGHGERAVSMLEPVVERHPFDEAAHSVWIEALAACGRQADALAAYGGLRLRLRQELGIDPTKRVTRALTRALNQQPPDRAPDPRSDRGRPVTAQLPAAFGGFRGREAQLRQLDTLVSGVDGPGPAIQAIVGAGGAGKTALSVRWAHKVADRFPDAQLYLDLRATAPAAPVRPIDALTRFLRTLGVPRTRVPADLDEASALFRSMLATRRVLILLDDARDPAQVRPLLPGSPGCLVLVTSRDPMAGLVALDGAALLRLDTADTLDGERVSA
ncbi:AfsR/SARP family transcriptional regulator [Actinophytocola sp.]|uniref:AfsR/SARP family transcriptional regulator n=1 Tax=Actinophytocola sp. TaxID=1872138 RepID=UPI002ED771F6